MAIESSPHSRRDGETIRRLPSGLEIVRRRKHEAIDFSSLSTADLKRLTGKTYGSKFSASWSLERVVELIAERVAADGWSTDTGPARVVVEMNDTVGYSNGKAVAAICIVSDGRYVHAYPVEA
jgi:hypothetical protein